MMAGEVSDEVRRWKRVAVASTVVAVAAVAGLAGWIARDLSDADAPTIAGFTGGGRTSIDHCEALEGTRLKIGTVVKVLGADGSRLAEGRITAEPVYSNGNCGQDFAVDGIPSGRSVYLIQVGRWQRAVTEDNLRGNIAEIPLR